MMQGGSCWPGKFRGPKSYYLLSLPHWKSEELQETQNYGVLEVSDYIIDHFSRTRFTGK